MDLLFLGLASVIGFLFCGVITALVAKWKKRSWLVWGVTGGIVSIVPFVGLFIWLILVVVLAFVGAGSHAGYGGSTHSMPPEFKPAYRHENIAIDTSSDRIWLRDSSGRSRVFTRPEILRWNTAAMECRRGGNHWHEKCAIELDVRDLDRPKWRVEFNRNGTFWISSQNANYRDMQEWFSRLTTWINNT